jgi:hypothetical protein
VANTQAAKQLDWTAIGRGQLYTIVEALTPGGVTNGTQLAAFQLAAAAPVTPVYGPSWSATGPLGTLDLITDNSGLDSPISTGGRYTFNGAFSNNWTNGVDPVLSAPSLDRLLTASGAGYAISNGALGFSAAGAPLLIDASSSPVVYWANGGTLNAMRLGSGGYGGYVWGLPAVPGSSISDAVLDKNGILYVVSGGQVSAIVTDSPGLGTASYGWPIRGHDACRSNNLEFVCPY